MGRMVWVIVAVVVVIIAAVAAANSSSLMDMLNKKDDNTEPTDNGGSNTTKGDDPTAMFTIKTPSDQWVQGNNITFDGSGSHVNGRDYSGLALKGVSKFLWSINGQPVKESSNQSTFINVFNAPATYQVMLTVFDNQSATQASTSKNITIKPANIDISQQFVLVSGTPLPDNDTAMFTIDSAFETMILNINITAKNGNKELPPNHEWDDAKVQMVIKADGVELVSQEYTLSVNSSIPALPATLGDSYSYIPEDIFGTDPLSDTATITVDFLCEAGYCIINFNYVITY